MACFTSCRERYLTDDDIQETKVFGVLFFSAIEFHYISGSKCCSFLIEAKQILMTYSIPAVKSNRNLFAG